MSRASAWAGAWEALAQSQREAREDWRAWDAARRNLLALARRHQRWAKYAGPLTAWPIAFLWLCVGPAVSARLDGASTPLGLILLVVTVFGSSAVSMGSVLLVAHVIAAPARAALHRAAAARLGDGPLPHALSEAEHFPAPRARVVLLSAVATTAYVVTSGLGLVGVVLPLLVFPLVEATLACHRRSLVEAAILHATVFARAPARYLPHAVVLAWLHLLGPVANERLTTLRLLHTARVHRSLFGAPGLLS